MYNQFLDKDQNKNHFYTDTHPYIIYIKNLMVHNILHIHMHMEDKDQYQGINHDYMLKHISLNLVLYINLKDKKKNKVIFLK